MNVVFPAPLGPISACRAPASNDRLTSLLAMKAPNAFDSDWVRSATLIEPPRLRPHWPIGPLRCPQKRGSNSRLGAALRRKCVPPRLRPHWPIRPLRCPQKRGSNSRLGAALRRSFFPPPAAAKRHETAHQPAAREEHQQ